MALGGEGKTSLVAKWAAELASKDWPGCEAVFAWSFYSQGTREQVAASADLFLAEALRFFGDAEMAGSAQGAYEKGQRLARLVGERRALLILDGVEPLQHAPTSPLPGELRDQGLAALLKGLAANNRGLCVVTTRYAITDLRAFLGQTVREEKLLRLSTAAGVALLKALGVNGSERKTLPPDQPRWNEYEALVEEVRGHALTLNLLGTYLRDAHGGDIRRRDLVRLDEANAEELGGHAFRVMDAYVRWLAGSAFDQSAATQTGRRALALWQLLGLFDRPATADCLQALWQAPAIEGLTEPLIGLTEAQRNVAIKRLEDARLLTVNRDAAGRLVSLDAHPLVREYFAGRMKDEGGRMKENSDSSLIPHPSSLQSPSSFKDAHKRLYEHLCKTTQEGDAPTLEDLQPLYQAVAHGCQAGLQQEALEKVYRDRILRGTSSDGFYSTKKLGALSDDLGAVARFFEIPWCRVASTLSDADQAWLLIIAARRLRALGRLIEALEPMIAGLKLVVKQESWKKAAASASNLSELRLTLGELVDAVYYAEQSVRYADLSGDTFERMARRAIHADALYQAGGHAEAETRFREAEQMQAEDQLEYPLLYSVRGFKYCDFLLAKSERAAWGKAKGVRDRGEKAEKKNDENDEGIAACRAVFHRAEQTLKWAEAFANAPLLDFALNHLTLGRAALCEVILTQSGIHNLQSAIEFAVTNLRRAGRNDYLPLGLLTRAWWRALTGALTGPNSAQEDLDEAWEIAERGSMRLHMADIHLYRARLFGRMKDEGGGMKEDLPYPWESVAHDLAEAERLINACGYHRRDEELADAKRALLG